MVYDIKVRENFKIEIGHNIFNFLFLILLDITNIIIAFE